MRFIPGNQFKIFSSVKPVGGSLLQNQMIKPREDEHFKKDQTYEISYIRPKDGKLDYHFINQTTGQKFILEFNSIAEADRRLEKLIGLDPLVYQDSED